MSRRSHKPAVLDAELEDLPPAMRRRVWMGRVEAVIFASPKPVTREVLAGLVGKRCNLDDLIEDIRAELVDRPYELVAIAQGWQHRTRRQHADAIRFVAGGDNPLLDLSRLEMLVLSAIAYFQPSTRRELSAMLGREISRDTLADLRSLGMIANGPKSPRAGAPNTYVTTSEFLSRFGLNGLQELPDREVIESASFGFADEDGEKGLGAALGFGDDPPEDAENYDEADS